MKLPQIKKVVLSILGLILILIAIVLFEWCIETNNVPYIIIVLISILLSFGVWILWEDGI